MSIRLIARLVIKQPSRNNISYKEYGYRFLDCETGRFVDILKCQLDSFIDNTIERGKNTNFGMVYENVKPLKDNGKLVLNSGSIKNLPSVCVTDTRGHFGGSCIDVITKVGVVGILYSDDGKEQIGCRVVDYKGGTYDYGILRLYDLYKDGVIKLYNARFSVAKSGLRIQGKGEVLPKMK